MTPFESIPQYTTFFSLESIQDSVNALDLDTTSTTTMRTSLQTFVNSINQKTVIFDKMSESYTEESQLDTVEYVCVFLLNNTSNELEISMDSDFKDNNQSTLYEKFKDIFTSGENKEFGLKTINTDSIINNYIYIIYTTSSTYTIGILIKTFPMNVFVPPSPMTTSTGTGFALENARVIETPKHSYSNQFTKSY